VHIFATFVLDIDALFAGHADSHLIEHSHPASASSARRGPPTHDHEASRKGCAQPPQPPGAVSAPSGWRDAAGNMRVR
jgi:hypothetical protein